MTHTFILLNTERDKHTFIQWEGEPILIEFKKIHEFWIYETDNDNYAKQLRLSDDYAKEWVDWQIFITPKNYVPKSKIVEDKEKEIKLKKKIEFEKNRDERIKKIQQQKKSVKYKHKFVSDMLTSIHATEGDILYKADFVDGEYFTNNDKEAEALKKLPNFDREFKYVTQTQSKTKSQTKKKGTKK